MKHIIFATQDDYHKWLSEPEESVQDTIDTALAYIAQLHDELQTLSKVINHPSAETVEKCRNWLTRHDYDTSNWDEDHKLFVFLEPHNDMNISVELSADEIEYRAELWDELMEMDQECDA